MKEFANNRFHDVTDYLKHTNSWFYDYDKIYISYNTDDDTIYLACVEKINDDWFEDKGITSYYKVNIVSIYMSGEIDKIDNDVLDSFEDFEGDADEYYLSASLEDINKAIEDGIDAIRDLDI